MNTVNYLDLLIGPSLENQLFKPQCLLSSFESESLFPPGRDEESLTSLLVCLAETDWADKYPAYIAKYIRVMRHKDELPKTISLSWDKEDNKICALTKQPAGLLKSLSKKLNTYLWADLARGIENEFVQAVVTSWFENVPLPEKFRGVW